MQADAVMLLPLFFWVCLLRGGSDTILLQMNEEQEQTQTINDDIGLVTLQVHWVQRVKEADRDKICSGSCLYLMSVWSALTHLCSCGLIKPWCVFISCLRIQQPNNPVLLTGTWAFLSLPSGSLWCTSSHTDWSCREFKKHSVSVMMQTKQRQRETGERQQFLSHEHCLQSSLKRFQTNRGKQRWPGAASAVLKCA